MDYSVTGLKSDIRIVLDRNNVSTQLFNVSDVDTLTIDEIIGSVILDAIKAVSLEAPLHLVDGAVNFPASSQVITWKYGAGAGPGSVDLPADFLRLISFRMSDWQRAVHIPTDPTSALYAQQSSIFEGVRGNPQKPIVAIVPFAGKLVLEFYSCSGGSDVTVATATYLQIPQIANGNVSICKRLKDAVVYYAASLVCNILGENDRAATLFNQSKSLMV